MFVSQAAQVDDNTKTTSAIVLVTIEDVNDNNPEFDQSDYTAVIPENSPQGYFVLQARVTDRDQVCVAFRVTLHNLSKNQLKLCRTSSIYTSCAIMNMWIYEKRKTTEPRILLILREDLWER